MSTRGHRGTRALQALIERAPATGALGLWMAHQDVDTLAVPAPIATDGRTIFYALSFDSLTLDAQTGWVAHQVLHVAFRHVTRREALRSVLGDVDDTVFNVCADALVNTTLSHLSWLALPARAVRAEALIDRALGESLSPDEALLRFDVESLYRALDDRQQQRARRSGGRDAATDNGGAARRSAQSDHQADASSDNDGDQASRRDGPRSAAARAMAQHGQRDLLPGSEPEQPEAAAENTRLWSERLIRGHASDGDFSLLRAVGADLPRSRVPWTQVLRRYVGRALLAEPELSWSRPSRSWIANRGRGPGGRRLPFEPGVVGTRTVPRLVVIVDVSGSIDDGLAQRFFGELNSVVRQTRSVAVVIVGDDAVREVIESPPGTVKIPASVTGGGGTDFAPLLVEAARHRPELAVVLTDLDGPAGRPPRFPVLWAATGIASDRQPPFGRLLRID